MTIKNSYKERFAGYGLDLHSGYQPPLQVLLDFQWEVTNVELEDVSRELNISTTKLKRYLDLDMPTDAELERIAIWVQQHKARNKKKPQGC